MYVHFTGPKVSSKDPGDVINSEIRNTKDNMGPRNQFNEQPRKRYCEIIDMKYDQTVSLYSPAEQDLITIKLTVPCETRKEEQHSFKKYLPNGLIKQLNNQQGSKLK